MLWRTSRRTGLWWVSSMSCASLQHYSFLDNLSDRVLLFINARRHDNLSFSPPIWSFALRLSTPEQKARIRPFRESMNGFVNLQIFIYLFFQPSLFLFSWYFPCFAVKPKYLKHKVVLKFWRQNMYFRILILSKYILKCVQIVDSSIPQN